MDGDTTIPTAILRVAEQAGEASDTEIRAVWAQIRQHIDGGGKAAILDFTDVDYLSEEGIAVLLRLRREMQTGEVRLFLCCLTSYVQNKITRMGLAEILSIYPDREAARTASQI